MAFKVEYAKFNTAIPPSYHGPPPQATMQNTLVLPSYNPYFKTDLTGMLQAASQYNDHHSQYETPQHYDPLQSNIQNNQQQQYNNSPEYNDPHQHYNDHHLPENPSAYIDRFQSKEEYSEFHYENQHEPYYSEQNHSNDHLGQKNDHRNPEQTTYSSMNGEFADDDKENSTETSTTHSLQLPHVENNNDNHSSQEGNLTDCCYGDTRLLQFPNQPEYNNGGF